MSAIMSGMGRMSMNSIGRTSTNFMGRMSTINTKRMSTSMSGTMSTSMSGTMSTSMSTERMSTDPGIVACRLWPRLLLELHPDFFRHRAGQLSTRVPSDGTTNRDTTSAGGRKVDTTSAGGRRVDTTANTNDASMDNDGLVNGNGNDITHSGSDRHNADATATTAAMDNHASLLHLSRMHQALSARAARAMLHLERTNTTDPLVMRESTASRLMDQRAALGALVSSIGERLHLTGKSSGRRHVLEVPAEVRTMLEALAQDGRRDCQQGAVDHDSAPWLRRAIACHVEWEQHPLRHAAALRLLIACRALLGEGAVDKGTDSDIGAVGVRNGARATLNTKLNTAATVQSLCVAIARARMELESSTKRLRLCTGVRDEHFASGRQRRHDSKQHNDQPSLRAQFDQALRREAASGLSPADAVVVRPAPTMSTREMLRWYRATPSIHFSNVLTPEERMEGLMRLWSARAAVCHARWSNIPLIIGDSFDGDVSDGFLRVPFSFSTRELDEYMREHVPRIVGGEIGNGGIDERPL